MINLTLRKTKSLFSAVYHDGIFRTFVLIISFKTALFCHLTHLGIDSFINTLGAIFILLSLSQLSNSTIARYSYAFVINLVLSFIFVTQSLYFKFFNDFLSIYNLYQYQQIPSILDSIISLIGFDIFFLMDLLILPVFVTNKFFHIERPVTYRVKAFSITLIFGIYCNLDLVTHKDFGSKYFSRHVYANTFGIISYQTQDIISFLVNKYRKQSIAASELCSLKHQVHDLAVSRKDNDLTGIGTGKNLILIQVESMQNFIIGRTFKGIEITPNLNGLLNHGILFRNIFDQTAAGNSSDAMFLANSSLYPAAKGTVAFLHAQNRYDSLAGLLAEYGYATMLLHAYYRNYWNFETLDRSLGFIHQHYQDDYNLNEIIGWGLSDRSYFAQSLKKIESLPKPFFVMMRTLTTHDPFDAVTPAVDNFPVYGLENKVIGRYLRSMHYVDATIGEFLKALSDANLLSSTVVVVYGDHRARLPEDELRRIGVTDMHENRKVPLIISCPNWQRKEVVDTVGGLIDLAPTISNILGVSTSGKIFLGMDLGRKSPGHVIFRDGTFISPDSAVDADAALKTLRISDLLIEKDAISLVKSTSTENSKQFAVRSQR